MGTPNWESQSGPGSTAIGFHTESQTDSDARVLKVRLKSELDNLDRRNELIAEGHRLKLDAARKSGRAYEGKRLEDACSTCGVRGFSLGTGKSEESLDGDDIEYTLDSDGEYLK